jgi:hypothetical protein
MLPNGFRYPGDLTDIAAGKQHVREGHWWFIDANSEAGELAYSIRAHDGRNLVPFAKVDDDPGDVACFDGNDCTGDPAVLMLVLDDSSRSYSYRNFKEWMKAELGSG